MKTGTFASKLRALRERKGFTVAELAERAGLHRTHYYQLERGERPHPSWDTVRKLAAALGVEAEKLGR